MIILDGSMTLAATLAPLQSSFLLVQSTLRYSSQHPHPRLTTKALKNERKCSTPLQVQNLQKCSSIFRSFALFMLQKGTSRASQKTIKNDYPQCNSILPSFCRERTCAKRIAVTQAARCALFTVFEKSIFKVSFYDLASIASIKTWVITHQYQKTRRYIRKVQTIFW